MNRGGVFDSSALTEGTFTVVPDAAEAKQVREAIQRSIAKRQRTRHQARFAGATKQLKTMLPHQLAPDETWNVLSNGDIDALSYVQHVLTGARFDAVILACWAISRTAIEYLQSEFDAGRLRRIDAYVGDIMPRDRPALHTLLCSLVQATAGRVIALKNHAKVWIMVADDGRACTMQTSANPNHNKRIEQTVLSADPTLAAFYKNWFDAISIPTPTFPNWHPYAWPTPETQLAATR